MSILLPQDEAWLVSNWISFGFFEDCLPYLDGASRIAKEIKFCINAEVDTLDLRNAELSELRELLELISSVILENEVKQGSNFVQPNEFKTYFLKLQNLKNLVENLLPNQI